MSGQYVVRIEIGWLSAIPHEKKYPFTDETSEQKALLQATGLAIVQPWASLRREEGTDIIILFKWGEWIEPSYRTIVQLIREQNK